MRILAPAQPRWFWRPKTCGFCFLFLIICLGVIAGAAFTQAEPAQAYPQRIVSLGPALTEGEKIKTNFNYTYLYAKDKETKDWLVYRPQHQYKLNFNYKTENGWTFDWAWRYVTKRFTVDNNLRSLGHYWAADLSISKKFWDIWEFQLAVNNLFDQDYEEQEGYPMPGTQALTNLKCEF